MRPSLRLFVLAATLAPLALGCSRSHAPSSPVPPADAVAFAAGTSSRAAGGLESAGASGLFPLQLGNHWRFLYQFDAVLDPTDPAQPPQSEHFEDALDHEIVCSEEQNGRAYLVTRVAHSSPGVSPYWIRSRQDRDGLYEWDNTSGPPACDSQLQGYAATARLAAPGPAWADVARRLGVPEDSPAWKAAWDRIEVRRAAIAAAARSLAGAGPAAVEPGELQRLRYPLFPGQAWVIRESPRFAAVVEGASLLRTPAGAFSAWAIRYSSELFGPEDEVRVWYGRAGYLGLRATLFSEATDESGNVIGTMVARQSETLTGIELVGNGPVASGAAAN